MGLARAPRLAEHLFLAGDVSIVDRDVPRLVGHRQVTDAHLLTLARRYRTRVPTFDAGLHHLGAGRDVELLTVV